MTTAHDSPDSAEIAPPQDDLATRKMLGPYELKKKLGQGGMGAVYLAVDQNLKRQVALKILPREKAINPQLVKRFKAEAQNASQLTHDNIVAVYGAGEADGYLYIALEFIDGIDVHDLVERRGVLPVKRSIDIIKQIARALQHALDQGIVHRDIKPANLLIRRDGVVKLADMGLARAVDESMETSITRAGTTVGTVDYMSPEQARNSKAADVRSDIYSLGCTWFHMLTGGPPFAEGSLTNKLTAHAKEPPPDARDKNPAVPEGVVAVMQRMMAKEPDERYQTPAELIKDLEGALVNKDAVSRKILEAIRDDSVHDDEDGDEQSTASGGAALADDGDSYPVQMTWSDSVAEVQSTAPDSAPTAPATSAAPASPGRRQSTREAPPDSTPEVVESTNRPATGSRAKPTPSTKGTHTYTDTRQAPAPEPDDHPTLPTGHKTNTSSQKPVAASHRSASSAPSGRSSATPAQNRRTLPPPTRKGKDETSDKPASSMSGTVKIVATALAIAAALGLLIFLANLAQNAGNTVAPPPVNPFADAPGMPPPPQAMNVAQNGADVAAGPGANDPTAKDVLIERNDQLEANTATGGTGSKSANGVGAQYVPAVGDGRPKLVPDWADTPVATSQVSMFSVRKGATVETERRYGSLQEAFKSVGSGGARIVLFHDGPFDLTPTEFSGGMLIIEAAQGSQPQIRLVTDGEHRKLPWLDVSNGTLALDGINIVGDAGAVPVSDPWSWIRVTDGHLYVRRSSFTLTGKRSAPTTALKVMGTATDPVSKAHTPSQFLLDQSVIRGEGLQCVQLEGPSLDGVIRRSLLATSDAAAISLRNADKSSPEMKRQLRFVNTTVSSTGQALLLSSKGMTSPVETDLVLHETLFAAPPSATQAVLLSLEDWPANKPRGAATSPFKNLNWTATGSAVLGFRPLLKLNSDEAATLADGPAWKKQWKEQSPTTFSPLGWPAEIPDGVAKAPLKTWSLKSLEVLALSFPIPDVTPGCPISDLRSSESANANSLVNQPQRPRAPIPFTSKLVQQVDLVKTDLGKLIASKDWDDGTVFVASGSGQRYSSPITVDRRKWRIQFRQTEGPTLLIAPRAGPRSGGENGAFITIRGGQLDIEQASFNYDLKDQAAVTPWFLYAEGGGFTLSNCRIVIPSAAGNRNRGVIRWADPAAAEKVPPDSEFSNFGQITDSLLVGNGTLLSADLARRAIVLTNSAFIGRQHLFELNVGLSDGQAPAAFDAQNCTYLAGGTLWAIKSRTAASANPLPARFGNYNCVFGAFPSDPNSKTAPLLMNYAGEVSPDRQILWYEESCGYSPELKAFFASAPVQPTTPLNRQDYEIEWTKRWGPDRIQRPLLGSDGVLFEKSLAPTFAQVRPENLTFHKAAKARTWSESGGPLGARPEALEPPPAPARTTPGSKKPANKAQPKITF